MSVKNVSLHANALQINHGARYQIRQAFKRFDNDANITNFSIIIRNQNNEFLYIVSHPTIIDELIRQETFNDVMQGMKYMSEKFEFCWWTDSEKFHTEAGTNATSTVKKRTHVSDGILLTRHIEGYYITYSFGIHETTSKTLLINSINHYFTEGDHTYRELLPVMRKVETNLPNVPMLKGLEGVGISPVAHEKNAKNVEKYSASNVISVNFS